MHHKHNPIHPPLCYSGGRSLSRGCLSTSATKHETIYMACSDSQHLSTMCKILLQSGSLFYVCVEREGKGSLVILGPSSKYITSCCRVAFWPPEAAVGEEAGISASFRMFFSCLNAEHWWKKQLMFASSRLFCINPLH